MVAEREVRKDFTGSREHTEQLEAAVAAWSKEVETTLALMIDARDEQIAKLKPMLQAEAEAKFPTSKSDLKVRARAESQQTQYVQKKLMEETALLKAEYSID